MPYLFKCFVFVVDLLKAIITSRMKKMTGDCNRVENPRMISAKRSP